MPKNKVRMEKCPKSNSKYLIMYFSAMWVAGATLHVTIAQKVTCNVAPATNSISTSVDVHINLRNSRDTVNML